MSSSPLAPKRKLPTPPAFTDVMVDLETLGRRPGCAVLSIGAVEFGPQGLGRELYIVVDRNDQKRLGLHEDKETLEWWSRQSEEAKQILHEVEHDGSDLLEALTELTLFLGFIGSKRVKIWGNGADFDNAILSCLYGAIDETPPWDFWNNRCYRTLKNLVGGPKLVREGTYHNALDDAKTQARHAIELHSKLLKLMRK